MLTSTGGPDDDGELQEGDGVTSSLVGSAIGSFAGSFAAFLVSWARWRR